MGAENPIYVHICGFVDPYARNEENFRVLAEGLSRENVVISNPKVLDVRYVERLKNAGINSEEWEQFWRLNETSLNRSQFGLVPMWVTSQHFTSRAVADAKDLLAQGKRVVVITRNNGDICRIPDLERNDPNLLHLYWVGVGKLPQNFSSTLDQAVRGSEANSSILIRTGELAINPDDKQIIFQRRQIPVDSTQYAFLKTLAINLDQIVPSKDLVTNIYGPQINKELEERRRRGLSSVAYDLCQLIDDRRYIESFPGLGYRLNLIDELLRKYPDGVIKYGDTEVNLIKGKIKVEGREVRTLGAYGFRIIKELVEAQGGLMSNNELIDRAWGPRELSFKDHSLRSAIKFARDSIKRTTGGRDIVGQVRSKGYFLKLSQTTLPS